VKLGVGTAVITPATMPVHLAGFGEPQVAHEVRDDLEVRAVYVGHGDMAVCLLVCDLLGMSHHFADPVRAAVGAALGLERAAVLTSCVHTHAGPSTMAGTEAIGWPTPEGFGDLLVERCVGAALDARGAAVDDVALRFGRWSLPAGLSINRRGHPYDPWFTALDVVGADGGRVATVANLSIHPVALGPECLAVSTDWVGPFRRELERRAGGQVVMLQGTQGDVNPHHVHRQDNECGADLFAEADELGVQLAEAVDDVLGSAEPVPAGLAIERHVTFDAPTSEAMLSRPGQIVPVELLEWSLGPVRVVSVPGEGFHELGRRIEARAGGKVLLAGLAPILQGYLPLPFTEGYEEQMGYGRDFVDAVVAALL
jgi:neutral ceramidase